MEDSNNRWGVSYVYIVWLEKALRNHGNVIDVVRHDDIVFEVNRTQGQHLTVLCLDEYVLGVSAAHRIIDEFPEVNFISVGGNWNGYTQKAKELCLTRNIGLYNSSELTGAIWRDEFWTYHKRNQEGDPVYPYRISRVS